VCTTQGALKLITLHFHPYNHIFHCDGFNGVISPAPGLYNMAVVGRINGLPLLRNILVSPGKNNVTICYQEATVLTGCMAVRRGSNVMP
jgi:hypothetical protein